MLQIWSIEQALAWREGQCGYRESGAHRRSLQIDEGRRHVSIPFAPKEAIKQVWSDGAEFLMGICVSMTAQGKFGALRIFVAV